MSAAHRVNDLSAKLGAVVVLVTLFAALPAHAQEASHMLTIADCPAGYSLAVQDMASPQPLAKLPPPQTSPDDTSIAAQNAAAAAEAAQQAEAPRQFITGCIPPHPVQNR